MDQGFKRPIIFSGNPEFYASFTRLLGYNSDNPIPKVPNKVIDDIPTGADLTYDNFNDPFVPPKGAFEAEELRISIDPTDANLNIDKYDGDYEAYYSALSKDYEEKTNLITTLEEKIEEFNKQIQNIAAG